MAVMLLVILLKCAVPAGLGGKSLMACGVGDGWQQDSQRDSKIVLIPVFALRRHT
jgi:hypothetical protein